jgi:hypothetical protein
MSEGNGGYFMYDVRHGRRINGVSERERKREKRDAQYDFRV